jgi:release factor glutamine methyltransferase
MRVEDAIKKASLRLKNVTFRPRFEAEILLAHHLSWDRVSLHLRSKEFCNDCQSFFELVERRASFEPIEYITKRVSFYSEEFFIDRGALIPRPETEILIDVASELIESYNIKRVVEVGIGSGAVSVVLAKKYKSIEILGTDISIDALKIANINLKLHNLQDRVKVVHTSLLDGIDEDVELIISNPPYISKDFKLEPNVINFEPHIALFAEDDGLKLLKDIVSIGVEKRARAVICEMGFNQREPMSKFFDSLKIKKFGFYRDLASLERGFWLVP